MSIPRLLDLRRHGPNAAELLCTARERSRQTQADIALHARTSASALSRYENGRMDPTYDVLRDLLQTCGYALTGELVAVGGTGWFDPYLRRARERAGLPLVLPGPLPIDRMAHLGRRGEAEPGAAC